MDTEKSVPTGPKSQSAHGLYERGEAYLFGLGHAEQDFDEARECFEDAAKLGLGRAYWRLGWMRLRGQGSPKNPMGGVGIWQAGAKIGDRFCWGELGAAFTAAKDLANARAAWREFFDSAEIYADEDEELEIGWLVCRYICGQLRTNMPLDFLDGVRCFQTEALHSAEETIAAARRLRGNQLENDPPFKVATQALDFLQQMATSKRLRSTSTRHEQTSAAPEAKGDLIELC